MRHAAIDVGTNSVLLLVAERRDGRPVAVEERMEITRLGRGVDRTRMLAPEAMDETAAAVETFARAARALGVATLDVVTTSAARDAGNGAEFLERLRRVSGVEPEILSGDREAELSFASARELLPRGPLSVIDIGGGSTEIVHGEATPSFRRSLDVGAVRLTERHLHADPPSPAELAALRDDLRGELAAIPGPPAGAQMVGVAGTVTTLCALHLGLDAYDGSRVHGARLTLAAIRDLAARLAAIPLAERRRLPGLPPRRADVIVAGAEILVAAVEHLGFDAITVSDRGVRWGVVLRHLGA
jgi:exopolyphosphatase/guanosine-5'-triphosphate,3'-diphosphate pyrophosphatase